MPATWLFACGWCRVRGECRRMQLGFSVSKRTSIGERTKLPSALNSLAVSSYCSEPTYLRPQGSEICDDGLCTVNPIH
jgi:hypothetical protein